MTRDERKRFDSIRAMLRGYQDVVVPGLYDEIEELKITICQLNSEKKYLIAEIEKLKQEMKPNTIGDSHEMGSW